MFPVSSVEKAGWYNSQDKQGYAEVMTISKFQSFNTT